MVGNETVRTSNHASKHFANFFAKSRQFSVLLARDVLTVIGKIKGGISFAILTVTIR